MLRTIVMLKLLTVVCVLLSDDAQHLWCAATVFATVVLWRQQCSLYFRTIDGTIVLSVAFL